VTKAAPIVLVTLLGLATVAAAGDRSALPVVFDSELVVLEIESDSLRVDGTYVLLCRPDAAGTPVSLVYPYPQDPELGGARTVSLACRLGAGSWRLKMDDAVAWSRYSTVTDDPSRMRCRDE